MCRTKTKIKQNTYNNALTALFCDERENRNPQQ